MSRTIITDVDLNNVLQDVVYNSYYYYPVVKDVLELLLISGCRINDVLEFNRWSVVDGTKIKLKPEKNNNDRLFEESQLTSLWFNSVQNNVDLFFDINYSKVVYELKKKFDKYYFMSYNKRLLSHIFRHNYAKQLKLNGSTDLEIKNLMGEKKLSSAQNYIYSQIFWYN